MEQVALVQMLFLLGLVQLRRALVEVTQAAVEVEPLTVVQVEPQVQVVVAWEILALELRELQTQVEAQVEATTQAEIQAVLEL
jgi:hypothetical protein